MKWTFLFLAVATFFKVEAEEKRNPLRMAYPLIHKVPNTAIPFSSSPSFFVVSPQMIKDWYGVSALQATGLHQGAGQTIAIIVAHGSETIESDLKIFSREFGLPETKIVQVKLKKTVSDCPDTDWSEETSLDVQWAHAIAPQAKILLVSAGSACVSDLLAAVDYVNSMGNKVLQASMSWGAPESQEDLDNDIYFSRNANITFFAGSGDDGASSGLGMSWSVWPASSSRVAGVGGTEFKFKDSGDIELERPWTGSGGGISMYHPIPHFQKPIGSLKKFRAVPDLSMNSSEASPYPIYTKGELSYVFGTSAATPIMAGMLAIANESRILANKHPLVTGNSKTGYRNNFLPVIYQLGLNSRGNFKDVTDPTKDFCNATKKTSSYCARSGYDLVTGLGSPAAATLLQNLVEWP